MRDSRTTEKAIRSGGDPGGLYLSSSPGFMGGSSSVVLLLEVNHAQMKMSQREIRGKANGFLELRDGRGEIVLADEE